MKTKICCSLSVEGEYAGNVFIYQGSIVLNLTEFGTQDVFRIDEVGFLDNLEILKLDEEFKNKLLLRIAKVVLDYYYDDELDFDRNALINNFKEFIKQQ